MPRMSVYQKIVCNCDRGTGMRLSPKEVRQLAGIDVIVSMAEYETSQDKMSSDERAHASCYVPKDQPAPLGFFADQCEGDGWYLCKNCRNFLKLEDEGL